MLIYLSVTYVLAGILETSIAVVWTVEFIYGSSLALFSWLYLKYGNWRMASV
jgi:hypothetical protein